MKVVILAGGFGTRIMEESVYRPKPMITIGKKPILWHLMKYYSHFGFREFIICLGYMKENIIEYFYENFSSNHKNQTPNRQNDVFTFSCNKNKWEISLVDTGLETMTGGRIKRIEKFINNNRFLLSYGDTLSNVNINNIIKLHDELNVTATLTTVRPLCNYGVITFYNKKNYVNSFKEKPIDNTKWINGGFYVLESKIFKYLKDDSCIFEKEPLEILASNKKLAAYKHKDFWISLETYKDKLMLEDLWNSNKAKWNIWDNN